MLNSRFLISGLFSLALVAFAGCSDDDDTIPIVPEDQLAWTEVSYSADDTPKVDTVPAREDWATMTPPLAVSGGDSGKEGIIYSLSLSHYWLLKNQLENGDYLYDWDAETGMSTDGMSGLQMLATAWSQVVLYRFNLREEFLAAAYRATQNYVPRLTRVEGPDGMMSHYGGALNNTAFMLFTLIELEEVMGTGEFTETIAELSRFVEHQMDESGCFWFRYPQNGACADQDISVFAAGQGLVSFERLYRHTQDERWLDLLETSSEYYAGVLSDVSEIPNVGYWTAWAVGPMVGLVLARPNPELESYIYALADRRTQDQYIDDAPAAYIGGFKKLSGRPPTWSAVSMAEGIVDAYRLAEARGDEDRMKIYRQSGILAARYLMSLQYRADNLDTWELADPDRALGAYHFANEANASSINMHYIRTDYMDHFAITLLKTLSYLNLPETYPGEGFAKAPYEMD